MRPLPFPLAAIFLLAGCGPAPAAAPPIARARPPATAAATAPPPTTTAPALSAPLHFTEPPVRGPIGTPTPLLVTAAGATGRWVAFCQARKDTDGDGHIDVGIGPHGDAYGDSLEPYLQIGNGPEEPIDEVVTTDAAGRYLVVAQKGRLVLVDAESGARVDLSARGADPRGNPSPLASHGAASLDAGGSHVLYRTSAAKLAVLDIAAGRDTLTDPGAGTLLGAWLDGPWVTMSVRVSGTPGHVSTTFAPRRCRGPAASYSVFSAGGTEQREVRTARISGGTAKAVPGFIAVAGDALLRRDTSGALLLEREGAPPVTLVGAECDGHVVGVHRPSARVLVVCKDGSLSVHGEDRHVIVDPGPGYERERDRPHVSAEPLMYLVGPNSDVVVDLERGTARHFSFKRISYSDGIVTTRGRRILLRRETGLFLTDFDAKDEHPLPGAIEPYPTVIARGRVVYVEPLLVDMDAAAVLGSTGRGVAVFAVLPTGHVLATPERTGAYVVDAFPPGPATWTWLGDR